MDRPLLVERQFYGQDSLTYYLDPNPNDPLGNGLAPDPYWIALHYDHAGRIDEGTISGPPAAGTYGMKVEWPGYDVRLFGARITRHGEPASWMGGLIDGMRDGSGLIYLRNRYYDPNTGRFTQEDPIGLAGGMNLYGFAGGDPVNFSDPFGLCPVPPSSCLGRAGLSAAVGLIPVVGDAVDIIGAAVGRDLIAGEDLNGTQRWAMALGTIVGSGRGARQAADVAAVGLLRREFDNVVRPGFWKNEAANNAGAYSAENLARMSKGKAPIGADGYPMELHHKKALANGGTNDASNLEVKTRTDHRLGENYRRNHPNSPD